jgi:hypothetical protein
VPRPAAISGLVQWPVANRALTDTAHDAPFPFRTFLPDGVMVAQATLTRLVMVRIHVGQPFDALRLLMACGRHGPTSASSLILDPAWRRMALSKGRKACVEGLDSRRSGRMEEGFPSSRYPKNSLLGELSRDALPKKLAS